MATVTPAQSGTIDTVANAASTIQAIDAKVAGLLGDAAKAKAQVVAALQAHVDAHTADIARHQAEVDAAAKIIALASPTTTAKADQAAAFVLTGSSQLQGVVNFVGRNWRYFVIAASIATTGYGWFVLKLFH